MLAVPLAAVLLLLPAGCGPSGDALVAPEVDDGAHVRGGIGSPAHRDVSLEAVRPNQLPETVISNFEAGSWPGGGYRVRVNWFGWDSDGYIERFEFRIAEDGVFSDWFSTVAVDSVMFISADVMLAWQLAVRSVDDDNETDRSPAKVTFYVASERSSIENDVASAIGARPN